MFSVPVTEPTQIASARRAATTLAESLGADETTAGRIAIVATELGSNILKHGRGGELLLSSYASPAQSGVQMIALDRGPGITDLQAAMRDGYSTAGSAGHGLGAIHRQSDLVEIASWPGLGVALLVRVAIGPKSAAPAARETFGAVSVPKRGEEVCGDAWSVIDGQQGRTMLVADGLGHGSQAASAAVEAIRLFSQHKGESVALILERLHAGLRPTRGAAVAIARFEASRQTLAYGGVGNIAGTIVNGAETRRMISLNGTAGHVARRIQTFDYPYTGGLVVMHSDGVSNGWSLERYPGLARSHPALAAAVLYRDFSRGRDDATVLVASDGR